MYTRLFLRRLPVLKFKPVYARFHISSQKASASMAESAPQLAPVRPPPAKFDGAFLEDFNALELFSFMLIGLATINKPMLNLCIKAFPYVPLPLVKFLVYRIYCGGATIEEVKKTGERLAERGINNMMLSLTIEACDGNDNVDPQFIVDETVKSVREMLVPHTVKMLETLGKGVNAIPPGYVAMKPTGFTKNAAAVLRNYKLPEYSTQFEEIVARASEVCETIFAVNQELAQQFPERVAPFVVGVVDAEKHDLQEGVYELQRRLYARFNKLNRPVTVVGTLQMYLSELASLLAFEEQRARERGYRLGLKLVRGAYLHSERERLVIHATKEATDRNYNQGVSYCIDLILQLGANEATIGHLVVASHNAESLQLASDKTYKSEASLNNKNRANICLGQLMGMADGITHDLIKHDKIDNVIKYVAWGPPLETREYLLRRLEENGDAVKNDTGLPLVKAAASMMMRKLWA